MQNLKVSIITVCLNSAKTIEQTIQSVVGQSYNNIEYIIIDGGSTDGTLDIIRKYEEHIAYWISEPDCGLYDAMNKGIKRATGEIVGIINSDDWYEAEAISKVVQYWVEHPDTKCSYGNYTEYSIEGFKPINRKCDEPIVVFYPHPTVFIKKEVYETIGLYNLKYKIIADSDFMFRCQCAGINFSYINFNIAYFRTGGLSSGGWRGQIYCELRHSVKKMNEQRLFSDEQYRYLSEYLYICRIKYLLEYLLGHRMLRYGYSGSFLKMLLQRSNKKAYIIWGVGRDAKFIFELFRGYEFLIHCFLDKDKNKCTLRFERLPILSPQSIKFDDYYVIVSSSKYETEICSELCDLGLNPHSDFLSLRSLFAEIMEWYRKRY